MLLGGLLLVVGGPALIVIGVLLLRWSIRLLRRRARSGGAAAAAAGGLALLAGLAITAQVALLFLYAMTHNPPRYSETDAAEPVSAAPAS